jgi:hypothetical protein
VYVPDVVTEIDCVVAPFDQRYDVPGLAVSSATLPPQTSGGKVWVIVAIGVGVIVIACVSLPLQPFPSVTVTLYVPDVFTLIVRVVAPVDQRYDA